MRSALLQSPFLSRSVGHLFAFWNAGYAAYRESLVCAVEHNLSADAFLLVAESHLPLITHIQVEANTFSQHGWAAIRDLPSPEALTPLDRKSLSLFRHDVLAYEGLLPMRLQLARRGRKHLMKWHEEAGATYRYRLPLQQVIRGAFLSLAALSSTKAIELKLNIKEERYFNELCFDQAKRALRNIVSNAIKYGKDHGALEIWERGLTLYFKDDGIGMNPAFAYLLGDEEPLREGRAKGVQGHGLGWVSIGQIARELGWRWMIDSHIGKGTLIEIVMDERNFVPPRKAAVFPFRENENSGISAANLVLSDSLFQNSEPFQGYRVLPSGKINIVKSPIYQSIVAARYLPAFRR